MRETALATSLARNTVRNYLRTNRVEEPRRSQRKKGLSKLAPFVEAIEQALIVDARRPKGAEVDQLRPFFSWLGGVDRAITLHMGTTASPRKNTMGQSTEKTQQDFSDALKEISKFKPAAYLKSDFNKFKNSAQNLMDFLEGAVDGADVTKARSGFSKNKPEFDKAKAALTANKKTVNDAQSGQAAKLKSAQGARGDVAASAQDLINALKGKTGPEADLQKAVFNFAAKLLPKISDTDAPAKIDAEI